MKKGIHPQMQWISYVTQSGRLMNIMMTKIHEVGKVYHIRARRQMAQSVGQIAKYKKRYEQQQQQQEETEEQDKYCSHQFFNIPANPAIIILLPHYHCVL
ncbi:hypothetical protein M9H77_27236 [Catharanthus roseus]|uniref:Uncharacterized protein n=1 Tax=Catharanthus roseus TaxID=4058 RepID=A0ACC0AEP4_CATRO|nr:hypothetical protein M9H77_27236 [Catharanthus roseus]